MDELKTKVKQVLTQIEECMDNMDATLNLAQESEFLSDQNRKLSRMLGALGVYIAQLEDLAAKAGDHYDQLRADKTLEALETKMAVEKAKLIAKTDLEVQTALKELRELETTTNILNRKSRSFWGYLENSRSRLSHLGRERGNI